jgi:hypothetical protein
MQTPKQEAFLFVPESPPEISEFVYYDGEIIKTFEQTDLKVPIVFTNYYTGDSTGSGALTSSGLRTTHFKINSRGWYTYKGYVVLAAATNLCLRVQSGACGKYSKLPTGFIAYNLYDIITFEIDGRRYEGIILDSCGACMVRDAHYPSRQKFDIFIADSKYSFGKLTGKLIMEE